MAECVLTSPAKTVWLLILNMPKLTSDATWGIASTEPSDHTRKRLSEALFTSLRYLNAKLAELPLNSEPSRM